MIPVNPTRFTLAVTLVLVTLLAASFHGRASLGGFVHGLGQTVLAAGSGLPLLGTSKTLAEGSLGASSRRGRSFTIQPKNPGGRPGFPPFLGIDR